jgi:uncharacterized membrane protein YedE/YeeE
MKTVWMVLAGLCIAVAAVFMFRGDFSAAFVVAAIGMIAWFLNYRSQMKAITEAADSQRDESIETDSDKDEDDQE